MSYTEQLIKRSIESCPRLGSLRKINSTFHDLTHADQDLTGQIAEIIRRDPSLTSRLLQMVNSVFYALSDTVDSVEDAVFYLGTKQIRQMALATPVLEDLQRFTDKAPQVDWIRFWQQSIGCAIMTRELLSFSNLRTRGDSDYISGLIFGVGYLVSIYAFPEQMAEIYRHKPRSEAQIRGMQRALIGWDQVEIGGYYMESHNIPEDIRIPVLYQHNPDLAGDFQGHAAAIYVAKRMIAQLSASHGNIDAGENESSAATSDNSAFRIPLPQVPDWDQCPELGLVLDLEDIGISHTLKSLRYTLNQIPEMLKGLV